jgi:hypothetical protein
MININPLDVVRCRELNSVPVHFSKVEISYKHVDETRAWILNKLKGRFCITQLPTIEKTDKKLKSLTVAAFEDQKELTYFILACPFTRRTQ